MAKPGPQAQDVPAPNVMYGSAICSLVLELSRGIELHI